MALKLQTILLNIFGALWTLFRMKMTHLVALNLFWFSFSLFWSCHMIFASWFIRSLKYNAFQLFLSVSHSKCMNSRFFLTTCGISSSLHACMKSNSRDSHCNGVIHIIIILRVDLMNRCLSESFWFYHSACDFSFHVIRHYLKRSDFNVIFILFIYVDWKAKSIIRISEKTTTSRVVVMKMTVSNKKILLFEAYSTTYYSSSLTAIKIAIWFE